MSPLHPMGGNRRAWCKSLPIAEPLASPSAYLETAAGTSLHVQPDAKPAEVFPFPSVGFGSWSLFLYRCILKCLVISINEDGGFV